MLHAVIMAGGAGTRFWPASRLARPKQLLNLVGERTMIQATCDRIAELVPPQNTLVVTNQALTEAVRQQLPQLEADRILGEPCKRDTAPCIGLAAAILARHDPEATMLVMPADHVIHPPEAFQAAVQQAAAIVAAQPQTLVTFGVPPSYPSESFGYIQRGEPLDNSAAADTGAAYQVKLFCEKPSIEVAEQYLAAGDFYWNAGIFVWQASTILAALAEFEPAMHARLMEIAAAFGEPQFAATLDREFASVDGKSIDYAVLEKHEQVVVIEAAFDWDDVGNWRSLTRQRGTDEDGNTVIGRHLGLNSRNCIVRTSEDHLIVTVGMEDCIVVHTPDATLVARKRDEEAIREIVAQIKQREWDEYL